MARLWAVVRAGELGRAQVEPFIFRPSWLAFSYITHLRRINRTRRPTIAKSKFTIAQYSVRVQVSAHRWVGGSDTVVSPTRSNTPN